MLFRIAETECITVLSDSLFEYYDSIELNMVDAVFICTFG